MGYTSPILAASNLTYGLGDVVALLGQSIGPRGPRTDHWSIAHVEGMIAGYGFPEPLPVPAHGASVRSASRWQRQAVDHWFLDRLPPEAAAADDKAAAAGAADDMDSAAAQLGARVRLRVVAA